MIKINNKQKALMLSFVLAALLLPTTLRAQAYDREAAESYNGGAFYELIAYDTYLDELANVLKAVELNRGSASITGGSITNDDFGPSPLGGGLGILIAAGAGYAALRRKRSRKNTTLLLACLLLLGFTQCKKEQPQGSDTEVKTVGITLKVGGNSGSKHTINTTTGAVGFEEHDLIYVGNGGKYIGTLECNNSGVFTGDINEPVDNTEMYFYFVGGLTPSSSPVAGTTPSFTVDISDQSSKMPVLSCNHVTYHTGTSSYSCVLQNQCALVKFTTNTGASVHVGGLYTEAKIDFANNSITNNGTTGFINLKSESQTEKWAVLLPQTSFVGAEGVVADQGRPVSMPAIEADAFLTSGISFGSTSSHNRYLQWAAANLTLQNGDHVYGTLAGNYKVSVAAGATVTLSGVTINGVNNSSYQWAGLNCLGNATINLADGTTNTVKGFYEDYPGIHVPSGSTLTIQGTGTLNASSNGCGAGIGGGWSISCGHITILSGTITATGGGWSAGIGSGNRSSCGNITISGGTVTATTTGDGRAAGIGCGGNYGGSGPSSCGSISISGGTVEATGGLYAAGIGSSHSGSSCGAITISGGSVTATGGSDAAGIGSGYESSCDAISISDGIVTANGGDGGAGIGTGAIASCDVITISGGTVTAISGYGSAGIGCGVNHTTCVAINISGGTVTATGGDYGAGIGSGYDHTTCGDITISGGTVEATGGAYGAGIGIGSYESSCGDITITNTVTRVTATKGSDASNSIGKGGSGTCGTVTIGGVVGAISTSPYTYEPLPEGALSGKFTINGSGDQVRFSQGNLRYTSGAWSFFDNQWDYYTAYSADSWDKFGLSTSTTTYGMSTSTDNSDYSGDFVDWGATIGTGWRTLTKDEWEYVFKNRTTGGTVFGTASACYAHATINTDNGTDGVNGIILFPDGVDIASSEVTTAGSVNANSSWATATKCTTVQWAALAAKGCVFLPPTGNRNGSTVNNAGYNGYYWASTITETMGYRMSFYSNGLYTWLGTGRSYGYSVRLVKDVN